MLKHFSISMDTERLQKSRKSICQKPDRCLTYIENVNLSFSFICHPSPVVQCASANPNRIFRSRPHIHNNVEAMGKSSYSALRSRIPYALMKTFRTYRPGYIIDEEVQHEYKEENETKLRELDIKFTSEWKFRT